jgi:hypothetical protein
MQRYMQTYIQRYIQRWLKAVWGLALVVGVDYCQGSSPRTALLITIQEQAYTFQFQ